MNDIYKSPESILTKAEPIEFTFRSLGVGRKIYIGFHWLVSVLICAFLTLGAAMDENLSFGDIMLLLFVFSILLGYAYWVHYAVVTRNLTQLLVLIIINIIPFMNPISAIILFLVRSRIKREVGSL